MHIICTASKPSATVWKVRRLNQPQRLQLRRESLSIIRLGECVLPVRHTLAMHRGLGGPVLRARMRGMPPADLSGLAPRDGAAK